MTKKSVRATARGGGDYSGRNAMDELGQEIELKGGQSASFGHTSC